MAPKKYYAVAIGTKPGIYPTWDECKKQTDGFKGAKFKSFKDLESAQEFLDKYRIDKKEEAMDQKTETDVSDIVDAAATKKKVKVIKIRMDLYFDGGSRNNGTPFASAGSGSVLTISRVTDEVTDTGKKGKTRIEKLKKITIHTYLHKKTNNVAEYMGCLKGLEQAKVEYEKMKSEFSSEAEDDEVIDLKAHLRIFGDSQLVIKQLTGEYQVKSESLKGIYRPTIALVNLLKSKKKRNNISFGFDIEFEHVYREFNTEADAAANTAMNQKKSSVVVHDYRDEEAKNESQVEPKSKKRKL
eukprot:CAMPEP_0178946722 /NCGR_PEP_ID=MMETSP0789-20121207/4444_1 /TAXON_ID=3005 /ORGANISM="Rhizosolenia setigera, Strain CCMP 1694" /LENGTH=298 /DNA_ID=CAMNT_0020626747 /DNA_START=45 /DNA_END=941 /DNA_ORIENTATION=+